MEFASQEATPQAGQQQPNPNPQPQSPQLPNIIDSTQSNSVRFFSNNVDSINNFESDLINENEDLFDRIGILEKELMEIQQHKQQQSQQSKNFFNIMVRQKDLVMEMTNVLRERDEEIAVLKQQLQGQPMIKEMTPLAVSETEIELENMIEDLKKKNEEMKKNLNIKDIELNIIKNELNDLKRKWDINIEELNGKDLPIITEEKISEMKDVLKNIDYLCVGRFDFYIKNIRYQVLKDIDINNTNVDYLLNKMEKAQGLSEIIVSRFKLLIETNKNDKMDINNSLMDSIGSSVDGYTTPQSVDLNDKEKK